MLGLLFLFFLYAFSAPVARLVCYDTVTLPAPTVQNIDVVGCQTNNNNVTNLIVNLFAVPSTGNYVFCVTDETGAALNNNIQINAQGTDLFEPGDGSGIYYIGTNSKTSCFYTYKDQNGQGWFVERRF